VTSTNSIPYGVFKHSRLGKSRASRRHSLAELVRVVVIGPDGRLLIDTSAGQTPVAQVAISPAGALAAFLDLDGEGGAIDMSVPGGQVFPFLALP
jgi:hypothetical protein